MEKLAAATSEDTKRILRTGITDALNKLKLILQDPTRNGEANLGKEMDTVIIKLLTLVDAQVPRFDISATPGTQAATPAAADDGKTKVPAFWRKNLDYGTR